MAVYKVPQDVEAESKFFGPLTFKQFLFFGGALICGFLMFQILTSGLPYFVVLVLPFFIVCVALAFPWTKDQPTEMWLASRIRFLLVPRKRIWDQDDVKELVSITVPKREEHIYSDGLSQDQIKSRLNALANVIDSKGWAVKNLNSAAGAAPTDRLASGTVANANPVVEHDAPDPLDEQQSTIAQQFDNMIQDSTAKQRQSAVNMVNEAAQKDTATAQTRQQPGANSPWFLHQPDQPYGTAPQQPASAQTAQATRKEQEFLERVHKQQEAEAQAATTGRMKTIQPMGAQQAAPQQASQQSASAQQTPPATNPQPAAANPAPDPVDPAILALAQNDDLNVATIARQANREISLDGDDEVVISLHDKVD